MTRLLKSVLLGIGLASLALCSLAQTVKFLEPTRTVFRCEVAGKITYSDALCRGAQRVDVQPTHGLNKASGTVRVGEDVRVEDTNEAHTNEAITEAIRPIAAMSGDPRAGHQRRFKLPPSSKAECALLDRRVLSQERVERELTGRDKVGAQRDLFESRSRAREIGC